MKKIAILCNSKLYSGYSNKIKTALEGKNIQVEILYSDSLIINNQKILEFDLIYSRLSGLKWTYEIMSQAAINTMNLIPNFEYYRISQNKYISTVICQKFGIKTPKTYLISTNSQFYDENLEMTKKIGFPFVLKPLYSSFGGALCLKIENEKELKQGMVNLFTCHQKGHDLIGTYDYGIIQELVNYKKLIRSLVVDGNTVACGYASPKNNWKCSVCLNPDIKLYEKEMIPQLGQFNKTIFEAFKGEIMIVDVFETRNGYVFNESNTACGLSNLEEISGINCAEIIANYLIKKL
ncbi:MAG: RimK family alpha-L-glutamate ligase [Promethearchaeota archaeon]